MLPAILGVGIYQINIVVSNAVASTLSEGALSALSFSNRLLELALGIFVVSISTVLLPELSRFHSLGEKAKIQHQLLSTCYAIIFLTFPVMGGMFVTKDWLIELLFQRGAFGAESTQMTIAAFACHIPGLIWIGLNRVLLTTCYASKEMKRPVQIAGVIFLANTACIFLFIPFLEHAGIALANTLSQALQTFLLIYFVSKKLQLSILSPSFYFLQKTYITQYFKTFGCRISTNISSIH